MQHGGNKENLYIWHCELPMFTAPLPKQVYERWKRGRGGGPNRFTTLPESDPSRHSHSRSNEGWDERHAGCPRTVLTTKVVPGSLDYLGHIRRLLLPCRWV